LAQKLIPYRDFQMVHELYARNRLVAQEGMALVYERLTEWGEVSEQIVQERGDLLRDVVLREQDQPEQRFA
jgi:hypothetical protein